MSSAKPVTAFWRIAGLSYLQYLSASASAVRGALKEPARRQALTQEALSYKASEWRDGVQGTKTLVEALSKAGKSAAPAP